MPRYSAGQPVRVSWTVSGLDGSLADASAGTLTVQKPDATTQAYSFPVSDSTGTYHLDLMVADLGIVGHYQWAATATGTVEDESSGEFDVFDPFASCVLSLGDAKDMLNIPRASTTDDVELASWIATIESSLEGMTGGPLVNRQISERVEATAGYTALVLRQRPLVSLQSVVNVGSGMALSLTDMTDLDFNASIVRRRLGWPFFGPFYQYLPIFTVAYTAGWGTAVPPAFASASRIIIQNLWETQHGPSARPSMGADDMVTPHGFGFAIPNRAAELLDGSQDGMRFMQEAFA